MAPRWGKHTSTEPLVVPLPLIAFVDNDPGYVSWIGTNPDGYVLNADRRPRAAYLKLHRATCRTVSGNDGRHWTQQYAKICGPTILAIDAWTQATLAVLPDRSACCHP